MGISIEPARFEWLAALTDGDDALTAQFGIAVVPGWLEFPEALPHALEAARYYDADPWGTHLFFDDDGALVGFGGFKGAPYDGAVEIGYAVAPSRRRRGIASAVTGLMVDQAREAGVERVIAHTLPEANPSTRVLERCGFVRTAAVSSAEDVDGEVWRWEHAIA